MNIYAYIYYCSKVWGHLENSMFSMKTHTFIHQMSCKMNRKYSPDIDEVRNNNNFVLQTFDKEFSICSNYSLADLWHSICQFVEVIWRNFTPRFLKHLPQVGLAWWALLTYHTDKLLPQQLNRVEIWWLRWPLNYR